MSWFKVDDHLTFHPKVLALGETEAERNEAIGAWVRLGAYCASHLTDGKLNAPFVVAICGPAVAARLVAAGWLEQLPAGTYLMHDYLDYNPSASQIRAERAASAERVSRWRERNGVTNGERNGVTNGAPDPSRSRPDPDPTRPDPTQPTDPASPRNGLLAGLVEGWYAKYPRKGNKTTGATALAVLTEAELTSFAVAVSAYAQKVANENTPPRYVTTWPVFCSGVWRDYAFADEPKPPKRTGVGEVRTAVEKSGAVKL